MDKAPREVYATLLDEGEYICSVRTMYRILDENKAVQERRNQLRHPNYKKPELLASGPNQVWSWDITKLLAAAKKCPRLGNRQDPAVEFAVRSEMQMAKLPQHAD